MSVGEAILLLLAGIGGGLAGSVAGLASLVSYPALLAVGLPPVTANVTNTVALVFSSIGSVTGSRPELVGQRRGVLRLCVVAVLGGAAGGALLLLTPSGTFALLVPVLIGGASALIILRPRPRAAPDADPRYSSATTLGVGAVCVYGGYFGAAAGVLLLALLLRSTGDTLARSNAVKNVVLGVANAVAAAGFAIFGPVQWLFVLPTALGFFIGGRLGPTAVRRTPERPLRILIGVAGLALAVVLAVRTYW